MEQKNFSHDQKQKPADAALPGGTAPSRQNENDFVPLADEVARRAYFSYLNEGSRPGQHVQHWLEAEAELIAERNLTRVHGFHNHN